MTIAAELAVVEFVLCVRCIRTVRTMVACRLARPPKRVSTKLTKGEGIERCQRAYVSDFHNGKQLTNEGCRYA
jgi:hypothetical protein